MDQNKRSRCVRIGVHDEPEYAPAISVGRRSSTNCFSIVATLLSLIKTKIEIKVTDKSTTPKPANNLFLTVKLID